MAANTSSAQDGPSLRAIDFAHKPAVMQVSTALRRLWLIDPDGLVASNPEDGSESRALEHVFPDVIRQLGDWIAQTPPNECWEDDVWKSRTDFPLLDPPEGSQAEIADSEDGGGPLFTPFRQQVYGVYDHIFWDVYHSLKDETEEEIGQFQPPSTTIMVLGASDDEDDDTSHFFPVDTFVYPVWIAPKTTLTFSVDGHEKTLTPDGHTWTSSLWLRAGTTATITPLGESGERCSRAVAAVLALGQCEERLAPHTAAEDQTVGAHGMPLSDGKSCAHSDEEETDKNTPEC